MSRPDSILRFLDLKSEDFDFLGRYLPLMRSSAGQFAKEFYDFLSRHSETKASLENLAPEKFETLLEQQARHFRRLLTDRFDDRYRADLKHIGEAHHRAGIEPAWVTGGYALYLRRLDDLGDSAAVPPEDRPRLRQTLSRLVLADLCLQLQGYACARSRDDSTREALTHVLISTILMEQSIGTWDTLMRRMCRAIVSPDTHIVAAWTAMTSAGTGALVLSWIAGPLGESDPSILAHPDNPCRRALHSGQPLVLPADGAVAAYLMPGHLPEGTKEIGIFPFGESESGYAGVGIFAADSTNYFQRIGLGHFQAISQFGDLMLNLRSQSLKDPLTGLPNRTLFYDRLNHALAGPSRRTRLLAIGVLNLDDFKPVNDDHGCEVGDEVLVQVAARLQAVLRPVDTLARLGGDEFGLLLDNLDNVYVLEALAERMLQALRGHFVPNLRRGYISASIGFTLFPLDEERADVLLRHADVAMYSSKRAGGDRFTLYSAVLSDEAKWQAQTTHELRQAISGGELLLYYQPQVDMATSKVLSVEALLRWNHPVRGLTAPGEFLDAIEKGPMAREIGQYVLDQALADATAWQEQGLSLQIAVNISARHMLGPEFLDDLQNALASHNFPAEKLEIEVTETTAIADLAVAHEVLAACRGLGVSVALDDFGTGNAPLSYLQMLPADTIKIDRSFVCNMLENPKDAAIVASVITAGRLMGLEVVGEGVESSELGSLLVRFGCRHAQGYVIAKPMPPEAIPAWVHSYQGDPTWATWLDLPWRPEDYGMMIMMLSHAQRARRTFTALTDPNVAFPTHLLEPNAERLCDLGRWLDGEGLSRFPDHPRLKAIRRLHDRLHKTARTAGRIIMSKEPATVIERAVREKADQIRVLSEAIQTQFRDWMQSSALHSRRKRRRQNISA